MIAITMDSNHTNSNPYHSDTAIPDYLKSLETLGIITHHTENGTDRYDLAFSHNHLSADNYRTGQRE